MNIQTTREMTTAPRSAVVSDADWTEIRTTTIAAHETPALFVAVAETGNAGDGEDAFEDDAGEPVNAYVSPLSLWALKTGALKDAGGTRPRSLWSRVKWGVIDQIADENGLETRRPAGVYLHPDLPMMSSRIDVEASDDGGATWLPMIVCNVAGGTADTWRNAVGEWTVPEAMVLQMQHHMAVTGSDRAFVGAMFGGVTNRLFVVGRDDELILEIEHAIADFWACVTERRRPQAGGSRDAAVMSRLNAIINPDAPVVDRSNDLDFLSLLERKNALSAERNRLDKEIKELNARLAASMDGVAAAIVGDGKQLSWVRIEGKQMNFWRAPSARLQLRKLTDRCAGTPATKLAES